MSQPALQQSHLGAVAGSDAAGTDAAAASTDDEEVVVVFFGVEGGVGADA